MHLFLLFAFNSCNQAQNKGKNFGIPVDSSFYATISVRDGRENLSIPKGFKTEYLKPLLDPDPFTIADISVEDSLSWRLHATVRRFSNYESNYFSLETMKGELYKYALIGLKHEVKLLIDSCSYERDGYVFLYRNIKTTYTTRDSSIYHASIIFSRKPYVFTSNFSFRNYTAKIDTLLKQYAWINERNWSIPK